MGFKFQDSDFERIAEVLDARPEYTDRTVRYKLFDLETQRQLTVDITSDLKLTKQIEDAIPDQLVTVMTSNTVLQLQGCTGFIDSLELGEVIFFARRGGITNGLVVERQAGCSLYANFDDRLLSCNFEQLSPELIMSTVALSMTETIFSDLS